MSTPQKTIGSRAEVWHGTALKTKGGLLKENLAMNGQGRIVSKRKQALGRALFTPKLKKDKSPAELERLGLVHKIAKTIVATSPIVLEPDASSSPAAPRKRPIKRKPRKRKTPEK